MVLAMVLIVTMPLFAERVTPETARKVAATFLNNNGAKSAQLTDLTKEAGFPNLYIFNGNPGFVVMAADDCVQPILGYSLTGEFVAENMPSNVRGWLQGYNDEIQYAIDSKMKATAETAKLWKELTEGNSKVAKAAVVVAPLIQTKWNQNKYYNRLCPAASGGPDGHAYVGCVATAMAQIMKYYEYPTKGIGSHSYTWNNQTLSADFGATTYDWANMLATYEYYYDDNGTSHWIYGDPTEEQIAAVATLSYHCGVAVDMSYGGGSSGAPVAFVGDALKSFFNYSPSISYKQKSFNSNVYYTDDEWITMVKAELDARRPLEYGGQDPNGNSGHAFVCDGYNNDDYFHFNWGWAGHYNGYFSIDNLNTGANSGESGAGNGVYTRDQEAVFGIQPVRCTASDPTSLTYTLTGLQGLTLNWTAADGAASYNIYRNGNYVGNSTTNSYSETAPFGDNEYYVRSVDTNGNLSLSSNYVNVYIGYQTPIVNDLEASLTGNNVQLSWTAPEWCYPETESAVLNYGQENPYYSWTSVYYAHRHLAANLAQYAGKAVYKVSTYIKYSGTYSLYIYTKSNQSNRPDPNSLAYSITGVNVTLTNGWFEFNTEGPIILTGTDDLWVVIKQENTGQTYAVPSFDLTEHNINAFYAGSSPTALYDCNPGYNCAWLINTYLTDGTYTYNLYQDGTSIAQNLSQTSYNATLHNNAANVFTVRTNYFGSETEGSNKVGFTKGIASLGSLEMSSNDKMTVTENSTLTISGTLSNSNPEHLILENGAQLINDSEGVKATVKKTIQPFTEDTNDGWNLIASPVIESLDAENDINGLLRNDYDLFAFDQSGVDDNNNPKEWRNYMANDFDFDHTAGYLYANSDETTLSFAGTLAGSGSTATLTLDANADFSGFNLIGNPYPCNVNTIKPFYVLQYNSEEDNTSFVPGSNPIPPCAAVLVQAQSNNETVNFSKVPVAEPSAIVMQLSEQKLRSNTTLDEARISFEEQCQLTKYTWGKASSTIYIPQNGQNFAVAYANGQNEMPLNFKAAKNGTYTLGFEVKDLELDYLHLIDNMTGADVDLLATPSYNFEGKTDDYESRFKLVFSNYEDANDDNVHFAYYAEGEIRLVETCHGASLQVVDMMGRVVLAGDAMNRVPTAGMTAGVYVLRLINGEKVMTQKIVIE